MKPGDQISRYRIERPLGQGGMGIVYLAEDTRLNRPVALKFLPSDSLSEQDKLRFLHEARAAALIRHPNICPIHDLEEADGQLFISMEYLEGETLANALSRGPLPVEEAVEIGVQIALGLDKAHSLGIVHRDIKSRNIIISPEGHASILDFGLALLPGAERLTVAGQAVGTLAYMSPEQCEGRTVDPRTDVWSLGVVLFEMLTAKMPFRREMAAATAHAILHDATPSMAALRPGVPQGLQAVVERALAKNPDQRWASAREMGAALRPFGRNTRSAAPSFEDSATRTLAIPASSPVAVPAATPPGPPPSRQRWIAAALGLGLVAAIGFYSYRTTVTPREAVAPAKPVAPVGKLIAILPFEARGSDAETVEIADGVTEILTAALSDFEPFEKGLAAIPSSEIRRRNIRSAADAKRVYGANLVVAGSASPQGRNIRFTLELIDPSTTRQLAAKMFEYSSANPVASQKRAVDELARLLSIDTRTVRRAATVNAGDMAAPDAYGAYLKGRGLLARYDVPANLDQAIILLTRAVELDPKFALAHSALGEACWRKSRAAGDKPLAERAMVHAEKAVELDPSLAMVHTTLAAIYTTSGREEDAIRLLKRAKEIAPGSAEATRELARVFTNAGRMTEAEAAYREAIAARPTDWYGYLLLGLLYYQQLERYDEAIAAFEQARALTPDNELIYRNMGLVYWMQGKYPRAVEELQRSLQLKPNASTHGSLGAVYYLQHRYGEAIAAIETAIDLDPKRYVFWGNLGSACKWHPGSEGRSKSAFRKAVELAKKFLEVSPNDHDVRANLAQYYAELGDKSAALAEIERIPESARRARANRIAAVYELTGQRARAIPLLVANLKNPATWHLIQDDPDLAGLWADPRLQSALPRSR